MLLLHSIILAMRVNFFSLLLDAISSITHLNSKISTEPVSRNRGVKEPLEEQKVTFVTYTCYLIAIPLGINTNSYS